MKIAQNLTLISVALCLLLSGCAQMQTQDPYTGEAQTNKTTVGATIGAIAGAIIGASTSGKNKGRSTAIGASVGALLGGVGGNMMDQQAAILRQRLGNTGVRVARQGNSIRLIMPGNITFRSGSPNINANFYSVLNSIAIVLKKYTQTQINVAGHTDNTGGHQLNRNLSLQRANSVSAYLQSQGIPPQRLFSTGYASSRPIASNATTTGRAQNRRVEITLQAIIEE